MDSDASSKNNRKKRKQILMEKRRDCCKGRFASINDPSSSSRKRTCNECEPAFLYGNIHRPPPSPIICVPPGFHNLVALDLGFPKRTCQFCRAIFWYAERLKSIKSRVPVYSSCCRQGRIKLPRSRESPQLLQQLFDYNGGRSSKLFRDNNRVYNSMFAFTSTGGKIDRGINNGQAPYVFKING
ncbi:uncharacterized protein LOC120002418 [Tripterygium wilfordii]|uniref:uncharacterized protein LOC119994959 n=1 Tax=Tripterygium wilfordii TaxID=458696 RepID=UPI0018F809FC|nr:uncharacterized protein LOC119994959 [Tripterygium wilfordii]XP_038707126.1 uncharacterized protein LOC120002418 [Tripterygium wilfordii]